MEIENMNTDFFTKRPGPGTRYIVQRYTQDLLELIIKDINDFMLKEKLKQKAFEQLNAFIVCAEEKITPHIETMLRILTKFILDEDKSISMSCTNIASLLGLYVDTNIIIPVLVKFLVDLDSHSSPKYNSSCLILLSEVLKSINDPMKIGPHLDTIVKLIKAGDFVSAENSEVIEYSFKFVDRFIRSSGKLINAYRNDMFRVVLQFSSFPETVHLKEAVNSTLDVLAHNCGFDGASELYDIELSNMLNKFSDSYKTWDKNTPDRYIFDTLIRHAGDSVTDNTDYFEIIIDVIAECTENNKDYELRMDMLVLIEYLIEKKSIRENLTFYTEQILRRILIPSAVWKVGKPNVKIRKASVICIIKLMDHCIIEAQKLQENMKDILSVMKGCLDDDWANDLRFVSCVFFKKFIDYIGDRLTDDDMKEIYPELLKRLDDSQDSIRKETAHVFVFFFAHLKDSFSMSLYDYMVKNILVHLDDSNEEIQQAVFGLLREAAKIRPQRFIELAEEAVKRFKHPYLCKQLVLFAQEVISQNSSTAQLNERKGQEMDINNDVV